MREKQIEKMTQIVKENASKNLAEGYVCTVDDDVIALYNAGYRDIHEVLEEVRKLLPKGWQTDFELLEIERKFLGDYDDE